MLEKIYKIFNSKRNVHNNLDVNENIRDNKIINSLNNSFGMGGCQDRSVISSVKYRGNEYQQNQRNIDLYYTNWMAKQIVNVPVEDMLSKGWNIEGFDANDLRTINEFQRKINLERIFFEALRLERLIGGCVIFMGIQTTTEDPLILKNPISPNEIQKNDLKFLNVVPKDRITNIYFEDDPLSSNYGNPKTYFINDVEVHESRLIVFNGDPILRHGYLGYFSRFMNSYKRGFGQSVLTPIYDDLNYAIGTRQAAYHLVNMASIPIFTTDMITRLGSMQGEESLQFSQNAIKQMSNYGAVTLDKEATVQFLSANFGSVPDLINTFLEVICAAADIPVTRFLGSSPAGLNSSGESELETYYGKLDMIRNNYLKPSLLKLERILIPSLLGPIDMDSLNISFDALWNLSELENAQKRQIDTQNIISMSSNGLLTDDEALVEAAARDVISSELIEYQEQQTKSFKEDLGNDLVQ